MRYFARFALLGLVGVALAAATAGSLDTTFGESSPGAGDGDGIVVTEPTDPIGWGHFSSVAVQADGKVVAAGTETGPQSIFVVARYNTNGSLDTAFGESSLGAGDGGFVTPFGDDDSSAESVVLDSNGGIFVLGDAVIERETGKGKKKKIERVWMLALVRLDSNGKLDTEFGADGIALVENAGQGVALALQADGTKIVAVARAHEVTSSRKKGRTTTTSNDSLVLVRFDAVNGALDASFDGDSLEGNGIVIDNTAENSDMDALIGVGLQSDNGIVVSGIENGEGFLRGYKSDGKVDWLVTLGDVTSLASLAIDASDQILVAGRDSSGDGIVERYSAGGVLDTGFAESSMGADDGGRYTTGEGALRGLSLLDGSIVACGQNGDDGFVLRLNSTGSLDTSFNESSAEAADGGFSDLTTPGDAFAETISGCAVDPDGSDYVICGGKLGGRVDPNDTNDPKLLLSDFFLARYCGN